jgi:hypothetical protein
VHGRLPGSIYFLRLAARRFRKFQRRAVGVLSGFRCVKFRRQAPRAGCFCPRWRRADRGGARVLTRPGLFPRHNPPVSKISKGTLAPQRSPHAAYGSGGRLLAANRPLFQAVQLKFGRGRPQGLHGRLPGASPLGAGKGLQLPLAPRQTGGDVRRLPQRPAAEGRCAEGGVCLQIKLAAGLRSVARNYKATRLLTRPGQATKSSAKDSSLRAVKLQYASWRPRLPRDHRRRPAKVPGQRPIRIRLRRAGENHPVPAWILT